MPWGAAVGAVVGAVANKALNKDKNGGAGAQTQTKEPWAEAAPWLKQQLAQGQQLQQQYTDQPFSAQQKQAYANQYAQSDYMRQLVPGLLGQMQGQQVGFDRENPTAKPNAWNWLLDGAGGGAGGAAGGGGGGLLAGMGSMTGAQTQADQAAAAAAAAKAAAQPKPYDGSFINQANGLTGASMTGHGEGGALLGTGRLGDFTYGMNMPEVGTKAYRDMTEYFNFGGYDPNNLYGRAVSGPGTVGGRPANKDELWYYFNQQSAPGGA